MKEKKSDRNLRELFRKKLEKAEIIPDPSLSARLMRRLAVREFMHFNPFRFNIYYLGVVAAAGLVAGIVLYRGGGGNAASDLQISSRTVQSDKTEKVTFPVEKAPELKEPVVKEKEEAKSSPEPLASIEIRDAGTVRQQKDSVKRIRTSPRLADEPLKGKELLTVSTGNDLKLQASSMQVESALTSSVTAGCAPLRVRFQNILTTYDSCLWSFGDGGSASGPDPEWIYDIEGEYKVILRVFGTEGLINTSSTIISVYPKPVAHFEIYPEKVVLPDEEVRFQNYSTGAVRYLWSFGDGETSEQFEPVHRYDKYGNYDVSLKVFSEYGCSDSLAVYNAFAGSAYFIEFPNAFIPNPGGPSGGMYSTKSDESAQVFHPSFSGVAGYQLKIFSKLGVLIFETNDINIGWDGYFKGQLVNAGVYIWKVRGNFINGEPFTKMGDVTLLKNTQ